MTSVTRCLILGLALLGCRCGLEHKPLYEPPNVLFILIDDLNDWVGALAGHPQVQTPAIDTLASRGILFDNAHCQAPICNPSRVSLFTGKLPSTTGIYQNAPNFREVKELAEIVTLPEYLASQGYETLGVGKLFHSVWPEKDAFQHYGPARGQGPFPEQRFHTPPGHWMYDWGAFPESDELTHDWETASWAIERLQEPHESPFFLAVGFYRPHVPLFAPQKWFDLYPLDSVVLPPVKSDDWNDLSEHARQLISISAHPPHDWFVQNGEWKAAVQAYLAATSFVDHHVGRVLGALESSPYQENTIVVLVSDHGWHLGEKGHWAKQTLWERSTRVPFICVVPGKTKPARCSRPVGLIDLYPTLLELCGLPPKRGLEGHSMVPLLEDPTQEWEWPVITTLEENNHAVRSEHWRYIRYADGSEELYDHRSDPNEWTNVALAPEYAEVKREHRRWLPRLNAPNRLHR